MIVDSRGRLFGRVNLLDLMALLFLLSLSGTVWYAVRAVRHRSLEIISLEPKQIIAGRKQGIMIRGTGFEPKTTIRVGNYPDRTGTFVNESTIGTKIPDEYEPGLYRVIVHDRYGRYTALDDAVEIVWVPQITQVKPKQIYNTTRWAKFEIFGKFFSRPCLVHVGDRKMRVLGTSTSDHLVVELEQGKPPLPVGIQPLTVTNIKGKSINEEQGIHVPGSSVTLEDGMEVLPVPEVRSVTPHSILLGQTADLFILGKNLRPEADVWIGEQSLGRAQQVSPECLRIRVTGSPAVSGRSLNFQLPDGPQVPVFSNAFQVDSEHLLRMVVPIALDRESAAGLGEIRESPEWRLKRRARYPAAKGRPVLETVLPVYFQADGGASRYLYDGQPLRAGSPIQVKIQGRTLSGTIAAEPFPVFSDDIVQDLQKAVEGKDG